METQGRPETTRAKSSPFVVLARFALLGRLAAGALAVLAACNNATAAGARKSSTPTTTHLSFDIVPVRPGGPADDWPAYIATSPTALPANTVVTATIRNFDVGDDTVPTGSPILQVKGTTNGVAYTDGKAYRGLDATHVSHTFTIMQLNLNVPIPGDPVGDANNVTVTFSFRTTALAGTYTFQCYVPCGTGSSGFDGPMSTMGVMRGHCDRRGLGAFPAYQLWRLTPLARGMRRHRAHTPRDGVPPYSPRQTRSFLLLPTFLIEEDAGAACDRFLVLKIPKLTSLR
jgi:hypothetical protein